MNIFKSGLAVAVCLLLIAPVAMAGEGMEAAVNTYVQAWNTGQLDGLDKVLDANFTRHVCGETQVTTLTEIKEVITEFRGNFPDVEVVLTEMFIAGDKLACRWTFTATRKDTGKAVSLTGMTISHWKDGKVVEEWVEYDNAVMQKQLGYTLTPPEAPQKKPAE